MLPNVVGIKAAMPVPVRSTLDLLGLAAPRPAFAPDQVLVEFVYVALMTDNQLVRLGCDCFENQVLIHAGTTQLVSLLGRPKEKWARRTLRQHRAPIQPTGEKSKSLLDSKR